MGSKTRVHNQEDGLINNHLVSGIYLISRWLRFLQEKHAFMMSYWPWTSRFSQQHLANSTQPRHQFATYLSSITYSVSSLPHVLALSLHPGYARTKFILINFAFATPPFLPPSLLVHLNCGRAECKGGFELSSTVNFYWYFSFSLVVHSLEDVSVI